MLVKSLTATISKLGSAKASLKKARPILPKPLRAIRIIIKN